MSDEKKSWDDIPSLGDLKVDWGYEPVNPEGRRESQRLTDKEVGKIFGVPCILVKISTTEGIHKGILQDISETGLALRMDKPLLPEEKVKLGFFLGINKVICEGSVRHVSQGALGYTCGIQLVDLDPDAQHNIHDLYLSHTLKHGN